MAGLYTIGYTSFSLLQAVCIIKAHGINVIIDVRSTPYSKQYSDYNKENIEKHLTNNKIFYRSYAKEFGARQTEQRYFTNEGFLDFELYTNSLCFLSGYKKIQNSIARGYNVALMCSEKDPAHCHRSIMISRRFFNGGFNVKHILADGSVEMQSDIETILLNEYFPDRNQMTFFENDYSENYFISQAYRQRNSEIGFRLKEMKNEPIHNRVYEEASKAVFR
jgi:uncharacterized protein (DUF488 family)